MKNYAPYALSLILSVISITGFSQSNTSKPAQFNAFPAVINCSQTELGRIFNTAPGQQISLSFSDNFTFSGTMTANVVKYASLQSAVITSPDYSNTIFSVSKIIHDDGSTGYIGRIINKNFFDGFELKQDQSGNYQLVKMETDRVIQDCSQ
ncbi:MAG TPA: hypothetical protein VHL77_05575 [Ferruginibacter sp.]|jgi:hypothetical protein|nr:hypothetical protein [Ferruginibacter sp.]